MISRAVEDRLLIRLQEPRRFLQVLSGPRQVGKTTAALRALKRLGKPSHFASADAPGLRSDGWIQEQWSTARSLVEAHGSAALVLDEIQKLSEWSEIVKREWDEDSRRNIPLHVVILGSAPLLVQRGLTESLAGRFEVLRVTHWSFAEMRSAFGWDLEQYLYYGGYPGGAPLVCDPARWALYIRDALIETTISRDVLLLTRVHKPALLRQVFALACAYSGQELSYQKMLGQLQDAGNNTTVAHYLQLLSGAGLVTPLSKLTQNAFRTRSSTPKLIVHNTALLTAQGGRTLAELRADPVAWGRLVESAVGAHLLNAAAEQHIEITYWRDRDREVDFVLSLGDKRCGIEVKSSRTGKAGSSLHEFTRRFERARTLVVGGDGVPLDEFLETPIQNWLG